MPSGRRNAYDAAPMEPCGRNGWNVRGNGMNGEQSVDENTDRIYLSFGTTFPKFFRNHSAVLQRGDLSGMITQTTE